jgi:hypothetical protein
VNAPDKEIAQQLLDINSDSLDACLAISSTRRHFFVTGMDKLGKRGRSLDAAFRKYFIDQVSIRPPRDTVKDIFNGQPVTLTAVIRLKLALEHLATDASPASEMLRHTLTPPGSYKVIQIEAGSVKPSIFFAEPTLIAKARNRVGLSRFAAAKAVYGLTFERPKHQHLFHHLEEGLLKSENTKGAYRVTSALAERIFGALKDGFVIEGGLREDEADWQMIFDPRHDIGPKKGDNTDALPLNRGNILTTKQGEKAQAA